jgi:hypothetical protein
MFFCVFHFKMDEARDGDGERATRYRALMKQVEIESPTLDWLMRDTAVNCYLDDESFTPDDLTTDERVKDYKFYTSKEEEEPVEHERQRVQGRPAEMGVGDGVGGLAHSGSGPVGRVDVRPVPSIADGDAGTGQVVGEDGADVDQDIGGGSAAI